MNFFKQAQDFAASANTNTGNQGAAAPDSQGFGSFLSDAQNMMQSQTAPADGSAGAPSQSADSQSTLPGGRQPPTNAELMESSKLLFGAAQGQQVNNQQLAGAAENVLGGLAAHGNLDQGQYGTYINQAEDYLQKYSGQDQAGAPPAAKPASARDPSADSTQDPSDAPADSDPAQDQASAPASASGASWMNN